MQTSLALEVLRLAKTHARLFYGLILGYLAVLAFLAIGAWHWLGLVLSESNSVVHLLLGFGCLFGFFGMVSLVLKLIVPNWDGPPKEGR